MTDKRTTEAVEIALLECGYFTGEQGELYRVAERAVFLFREKHIGDPVFWLSDFELSELAMPASTNRTVTAWRQPMDKTGRVLVGMYKLNL